MGKSFFVLSFLLVTIRAEQSNTNGVRLCGKHLADVLTLVCEQNGGFHAPKLRRTVSPGFNEHHILMHLLHPRSRRTEESSMTSPFSMQGGVVSECCRKACTLEDLTSYCAINKPIENMKLEDILASTQRKVQGDTEEYHQLQQQTQEASVTTEPEITLVVNPLKSSIGQSSRPNLGSFSRKRPVFIVLSQLQEEGEEEQEQEDPLLGEYRF